MVHVGYVAGVVGVAIAAVANDKRTLIYFSPPSFRNASLMLV